MSDINEEQRSLIKALIEKGKEQGYLTYAEVNEQLQAEIVDPEQIEDIILMLNDMGIDIYEEAPEEEELILGEEEVVAEEVLDESATALVSAETELGRTTDPVRMYMREMGTVELLTREGEIAIAKRIEEGVTEAMAALASYPRVILEVLQQYDRVNAGEMRLGEILSGFIDPTAQIEEEPTELLDLPEGDEEAEIISAEEEEDEEGEGNGDGEGSRSCAKVC
jgi:RNA polymerase primary sigma factor